MKSKLFFFLLIIITFAHIQGQEQVSTIKPPLIETTEEDEEILEIQETDNKIYPKEFQENFYEKYSGEEFDYTLIKPQESLWERVKRGLISILETIFGELNPNVPINYAEIFIKTVSVIIVGVLLYFLIRYLLKKDGNFFWSKKNQNTEIPTDEIHENIHEINFPLMITQLEQQKDFRSAVRYQFLWVLKQLTDNKLIVWNPEKTNKDYIIEIQNSDLQNDFKEISRVFDYVWYGEFEIDEPTYFSLTEKWKQIKI